ncbi:MAG TPA: lipase maturation factor family protein [Burkholderiales bacterium]|nr:lipase maturation factor family protein [Burkholderiales bacterium]
MKFLRDLLERAPDHELAARLFLKGLALIYAAAFTSLAVQINGLAGPEGILPFQQFLDRAFDEDGYVALWRIPTLFWLVSSKAALQGAAIAGAGLALLLLLGVGRPRPILILLFVLYLSLYQAGQIFMIFQWDYLLLESGFLAIFLVGAPTRLVVLLYHWLLFRLRFLSGFYKLASGDPSWRHFKALNYYFETQPLPHVGSWYAHQLPEWVLKTGVGFTFFAELIVPFFIFLPRPFRIFAATTTILAQLLIIATSNHNFFNLLTILLCLFVLDDRILRRILPARFVNRPVQPGAPHRPGLVLRTLTSASAALILALSVGTLLTREARRPLPQVLYEFTAIAPSFGIGNLFHVFPTMQTKRQELRIFGSYDGVAWEAYEFRYKPDALDKAPPFVVPHQPRLDWMMWFLPTQWPDTSYWLEPFLEALRQNRPSVTRLLARNPFEGKPPPRMLRVLAYRYRFTTPQERASTGNWWKAELLGEYPDVSPRRP